MTTDPDDDRPVRRCCPRTDCRSLDVVKRVRMGGFRCGDCGWTGGITDHRAVETKPSRPQGMAGVLLDADPEEVR